MRPLLPLLLLGALLLGACASSSGSRSPEDRLTRYYATTFETAVEAAADAAGAVGLQIQDFATTDSTASFTAAVPGRDQGEAFQSSYLLITVTRQSETRVRVRAEPPERHAMARSTSGDETPFVRRFFGQLDGALPAS